MVEPESLPVGTSERRDRERQQVRTKILDAARELFAVRGYEAVTMREIAKRIEYSATALYGHFADKETLLRELCREDFAAFAQRFVAEVASSGDPVERICRAGLVYLSFAEQYPQHYRLMFMADLPPNPPRPGEREDPAQNAYAFLRLLVDELMDGGSLRPELTDRDLAAQTIWAMVHGAAALDLSLCRADWIDFVPRERRYAAALEALVFGMLRDPEQGKRTLERVLAQHFRGEGR